MKSGVALLLLSLCCACVFGCGGELLSYKNSRSAPVTTSTPWVFSVSPVEHDNRSPDAHISQFPYFYTFCVPLQRTPLKAEETTALLNFDFADATDEVVVDFDYSENEAHDYVNKDSVKTISLSMFSESEFRNGWSEKKGLSGKVYTKTPLSRVTLKAAGIWQETHDKELLCASKKDKPNQPQKPQVSTQDEEAELLPLKQKHSPIVFICVSFLILFSILMCCCNISTVKEEEMAEFAPIPQNTTAVPQPREEQVVIDEEELLRRVQEQSRQEFEAQNNEYSVGAQREALAQYMKAPVMTPEAYATYLSAQ